MPENSDAVVGLFFEVTPKPGHSGHYFSFVERLKPESANYEGLLSLSRYRALFDGFSLLSHQLWDSEKSLENWRQNKMHRLAQKAGIKKHFKNYRIRIGQRLAFWPADTVPDAHFELASEASELLLSIQSRVFIPTSAFNKHASLDCVYCDLSSSDQFITLVTPNNLSSAMALTTSMSPDFFDKIELFLISRNYSMIERDQSPSAKHS